MTHCGVVVVWVEHDALAFGVLNEEEVGFVRTRRQLELARAARASRVAGPIHVLVEALDTEVVPTGQLHEPLAGLAVGFSLAGGAGQLCRRIAGYDQCALHSANLNGLLLRRGETRIISPIAWFRKLRIRRGESEPASREKVS